MWRVAAWLQYHSYEITKHLIGFIVKDLSEGLSILAGVQKL